MSAEGEGTPDDDRTTDGWRKREPEVRESERGSGARESGEGGSGAAKQGAPLTWTPQTEAPKTEAPKTGTRRSEAAERSSAPGPEARRSGASEPAARQSRAPEPEARRPRALRAGAPGSPLPGAGAFADGSARGLNAGTAAVRSRTGATAVAGGAAEAAAGEAAAGYQARRTLPLRVEAVRQWRRRRTLVALAMVVALPVVVWAAFAIGGRPRERNNVPSLVDVATSSGLNFALAVVFVSSGFLLTLPVALFFGDTVASEAGWSSLRYLLAAPVPRARLLVSKAVVAFVFSALAVVALPAVALAVGTAAYGWGGLDLPTGGALPAGTAAGRFAVIVAYVFVSQLTVAGLAFWLSTVTDAPLGAVGGAVGAAIVSNILDAITALGPVRQVLPTHWQFAWIDLLQPGAQWSGAVKGVSVSVSFAVVFLALAFRRFRYKDIVS